MAGDFHGFASDVFEWFAGLERDNSRAYFAATRERYERDVRGGLQAMLDELNAWLDEHVGRSAMPPPPRAGRSRR
jgi:uncharacterized protein (DUF2461 family)